MADIFDVNTAAKKLLFLLQNTPSGKVIGRARNITAGEIGVLSYLAEQQEAVKAGMISKSMGIGSSGVTNLLNALEKKGYVQREINHSDRRSILVSISEEGRSLMKQRQKEAEDFTEELLRRMGEEDTQQLLRLAEKLSVIGADLVKETYRKD